MKRYVKACVAIFGLFVLDCAHAQVSAYPNKPIRLIVPSGAGGITDILARIIGQKLTEAWGQQVLVDNRVGASGTIGSDMVAKASPDGYTLLMVYPTHPVNPSLYAKLPYDTINDFAPITMVSAVNLVLVVNPTVPARNLKELIDLAKAKPGALNYGAVGEGSLGHLAAEVFRSMAGIKIVHVPYRGAPQVTTALLGNEVQMFFDVTITAIPQMKAGKVRGLAVTSSKRATALPELPTMAEAGLPGYEVIGWNGILAPAGTPAPVIRKLHAEIVRILNSPEMRARLAADAVEPIGNTPEEFAAVIKADVAKWAKVVKEAGMKAE
jgi:tripartite-type tricarboxylate transporter receptor subunit TctC